MLYRPDSRSVEEIVRDVLAYAANSHIETIVAGQRLRDLGIDSVGSLAVGVVLQAEIGVELDAEELTKLFDMGNVADLVDCVARRAGLLRLNHQ